jgi:hypothetical protein
MTDDEREEFEKWILIGIERKWISDVVCAIHEGLPNTEEEEKDWEDGYDTCIPGIRVWAVG